MKRIPIHPFIFALFPVLSFYLKNTTQVPFQEVFGTLVIVSLTAMLLWFLFYLALRNVQKAAVIASAFLMLFFSHHSIMYALMVVVDRFQGMDHVVSLLGSELVPLAWLCAWLVLFGLAFYAIARSKRGFSTITAVLNVMSVSLAAVLLFNWYSSYARSAGARAFMSSWAEDAKQAELDRPAGSSSGSSPDIYYIVLDGYARSDILELLYQYDNSRFLSGLSQKGFYVAGQSRSNYVQTALSLASSLNLDYLDSTAEQVGTESTNLLPLWAMIKDSRVAQHLRSHGYTTVSFSTGFSLTDLRDADFYSSPRALPNGFQSILMNSTPLPILLELPFLRTQYDMHRERIQYTLDHLVDASEIEPPTFIFAHIVAPHPPFVFGENGKPIQPDSRFTVIGGYTLVDAAQRTALIGRSKYVESYREQLDYITERLQIAIEEILARSPVPPIIILQADHGPGSMLDWRSMETSNLVERMAIFNAYYFPGQNYRALYPSITPVNTFRVILNDFWTTDYEILGDRSYFSTPLAPYSFIDVTAQVSISNGK